MAAAPPTQRQLDYLRSLAAQLGVEAPVPETKAGASGLIGDFQRRLAPVAARRPRATRVAVRGVRCPRCEANAGFACTGLVGSRSANHQERVEAFLAEQE